MSTNGKRKACDSCHSSKVRCITEAPNEKCRRCIRLGLHCEYSKITPRRYKNNASDSREVSQLGIDNSTARLAHPENREPDLTSWLQTHDFDQTAWFDDIFCNPASVDVTSDRIGLGLANDMVSHTDPSRGLPNKSDIDQIDPAKLLSDFSIAVDKSSMVHDSTELLKVMSLTTHKIHDYFIRAHEEGLKQESFSDILLYISLLHSVTVNLQEESSTTAINEYFTSFVLEEDDLKSIRCILQQRIAIRIEHIADLLIDFSIRNHRHDDEGCERRPCALRLIAQKLKAAIVTCCDLCQRHCTPRDQISPTSMA